MRKVRLVSRSWKLGTLTIVYNLTFFIVLWYEVYLMSKMNLVFEGHWLWKSWKIMVLKIQMSGDKCLKIQMGVKCLVSNVRQQMSENSKGRQMSGDKCLKIQTGVKCLATNVWKFKWEFGIKRPNGSQNSWHQMLLEVFWS